MEETKKQTVNDEEITDKDLTDLEDESEDEESENVDDNLQDDDEKPSEKSKKQSREENAKQAAARRKAEFDKAVKEAYEKGKKEGLESAGSINSFTGEPISDEYDLKIFNLQKKIKEEGGDPLKDLAKRLATEERESAKKIKDQEAKKLEEDQKITKDLADFKKEFPDVNIEKLMKENKTFINFSNDKLGNKPLSQIYKDYKSLLSDLGIEDKDEKINKEAKKKTNTPSSFNAPFARNVEYDEDYSEEELANMTLDEVMAYRKKHY